MTWKSPYGPKSATDTTAGFTRTTSRVPRSSSNLTGIKPGTGRCPTGNTTGGITSKSPPGKIELESSLILHAFFTHSFSINSFKTVAKTDLFAIHEREN
jgi:hypothetical protein